MMGRLEGMEVAEAEDNAQEAATKHQLAHPVFGGSGHGGPFSLTLFLALSITQLAVAGYWRCGSAGSPKKGRGLGEENQLS